MGEENSKPFPIPKKVSDRTPHARIDEVEDDISAVRSDITALRERLAGMEAMIKGFITSVDGMKVEVGLMRADFAAAMSSLQRDILGTFSRLFIAMILVVVFSIAAISALVGSGVYFSGMGFKLGTTQDIHQTR